jgi:hypothetical protein
VYGVVAVSHGQRDPLVPGHRAKCIRTALSPSSMSRAVAAFVAIWQNASCGVRMLIACQLRFSTSTIVLFSMSLIKS